MAAPDILESWGEKISDQPASVLPPDVRALLFPVFARGGAHLRERKPGHISSQNLEAACHSREIASRFDNGVLPSEPQPRHYATAFAAVVLVAVAGWLAWRHYAAFDWARFAGVFSLIQLPWLLAGLLLSFSSFAGRAVRWQFMMQPAPSAFSRVWEATLIGFSAVILLGRAGELVRPYLIARSENSELPAQAATWVLERLYDFLAILLLFGIGVSYARGVGAAVGQDFAVVLHVAGWVIAGGAASVVTLLYLMGRRRALCQRLAKRLTGWLPGRYRQNFRKGSTKFFRGASMAGSFTSVLISLVLTLTEWSLILLSVWCFFRSFPPASDIRLIDAAAFLGFTSVGGIVQLPGIGGGLQIAAVVVLTELFRLPVEQATGFALLVWAGTSLVVLPAGIPLAFYRGLNIRELKKIGEKKP